ncbi:hypothetical protein [Nocardioides bruguierae]|uniref:hypothetical protein n=1 Tax=Nocardioides bruguierae TaxID=2945102 RepID=UPI00202232F6|nr:hypothetical protein [Nocardioides bruguierae]MCL8026312.1 hypothetical protein [Nocardioides bruguierae]
MAADFIWVYRKDNGEKQRVPAHWMDHRVLSRPFRKTPKTRAAEQQPESTTSSTPTSTDDAPAAGDKE